MQSENPKKVRNRSIYEINNILRAQRIPRWRKIPRFNIINHCKGLISKIKPYCLIITETNDDYFIFDKNGKKIISKNAPKTQSELISIKIYQNFKNETLSFQIIQLINYIYNEKPNYKQCANCHIMMINNIQQCSFCKRSAYNIIQEPSRKKHKMY